MGKATHSISIYFKDSWFCRCLFTKWDLVYKISTDKCISAQKTSIFVTGLQESKRSSSNTIGSDNPKDPGMGNAFENDILFPMSKSPMLPGNAFENKFHDDMNDEKPNYKEKSVENWQSGQKPISKSPILYIILLETLQKPENDFAFNNEVESGGAEVIKPDRTHHTWFDSFGQATSNVNE